jgi:CubicO group peptidase (beta-lactamase class C family)
MRVFNSLLLKRLTAIVVLISLGGLAIANPSAIERIDPAALNLDETRITTIRERMQAAVDSGHLPGALLLVGNRDGVAMLESVGTQGPGDDTPIDIHTIFRIYSMTKPVVSVAAMSMVEDGLISVDDPVSQYIPAFADAVVIHTETGETRPAQNTMTIEHLLTHQSGIIQSIFAMGTELGRQYVSTVISDGSVTGLEMAEQIASLPLLFEPGTAWHYGHSTDVLGAVLEVAAGKPLDEIFEERIFGPLGMTETTFYVPSEKAHRIAEPIHGEMADNTVVRPQLSGGGGLNSTAEDYVRFAQMLLNGGEFRGERIIEQSTLDWMSEERITDEVSREHFFYGPVGGWSMGFHLQPVDPADPAGPVNIGWRGIGGTLFVVDRHNDFYLLYMEQRRGGPPGAPFGNTAAQNAVYEAIFD